MGPNRANMARMADLGLGGSTYASGQNRPYRPLFKRGETYMPGESLDTRVFRGQNLAGVGPGPGSWKSGVFPVFFTFEPFSPPGPRIDRFPGNLRFFTIFLQSFAFFLNFLR